MRGFFKVCSAVLVFSWGLAGTAQAWQPQSAVKVIVAYKAGSGTDTGARVLAEQAEKYVGQKLEIVNIPGADGVTGWTELAHAQPDGLTIGFINLPTFTTLSVVPDPAISLSDIVPVCNHLTETAVVAVRSDSPYQTLPELVKAARERGNLVCSTNGLKASNHTAAQLLASTAQFPYEAKAYGGTADQVKALLDGEADFTCAKLGDVAALIKGDTPRVRLLGVYAKARLPQIAKVPTLGELGYYNKWYGSARGLVLPKGTAPEIVSYYEEVIRQTLKDPACIAAHEAKDLEVDYKDSAEFAELIAEQQIFCRDVISELYDVKFYRHVQKLFK
ncbi:MAG: tripartite tricarboxylate transporter substrate binding protein [Succinivibrio sp.]|nr:tripartite tricarboxylate transporter substrate binding protein [Succinivibrio sp.]